MAIYIGYQNFDHVGIDFHFAGITRVRTHVLVLSVEVRRSERLWHTLDIHNMFDVMIWI